MQYERDALIAGLIALAGLLKANPKLPIPVAPVVAHAFPDRGPDDEMRAKVDKVADLLGTEIDPAHTAYGHYQTAIEFGPVRYEFTAILAAARAHHDAVNSYRDSVQIDNP